MTTATRNEAAERLRDALSRLDHKSVYDTAWLDALDTALAAERRATVERIREKLTAFRAMDDEIATMLDQEASR